MTRRSTHRLAGRFALGHVRSIAVLLLSVVCLGVFAQAAPADYDRRERAAGPIVHPWVAPPWWGSVGDNFPPPPALQPYFLRFARLYLAYQALGPDDKPSFSHWLIMHGVTDPVAHQAMLLLYVWAERQQ